MDEFWIKLIGHAETAALLPLCLLIVFVVHELGHYLAARYLGLQVESVTFGRGHLLWSRKDRHGTLWNLHVWPLRAHVQITGFEQGTALPLRNRLLVVLAGPLANLVFPAALFFLFFMSLGKPAIPNIVTSIEPAMPAYQAGLRPGDKILAIDGEEVKSMEDIMAHTYPRHAKPFIVAYERQGEIFSARVKPVWIQYRDINGVFRSHGRIGLSTVQQGYNLKAVRSVNGVPTPTMEAARAALLQHMDERITVGLWSMDDNVYTSVMDLSAVANKHLGDLQNWESKKIYMGAMRDNFYLPLSAAAAAREAFWRNAQMIAHMALLPFNLFPIDKEWITPDAIVTGEASFLGVRLYVFVFFTSLCSCFIGLLNLLPFPRLDGGNALLMLAEAWKHRPLTNHEKAALLVFSILFFYAAVFGANANDMRGYYLFQMQRASAAEQ